MLSQKPPWWPISILLFMWKSTKGGILHHACQQPLFFMSNIYILVNLPDNNESQSIPFIISRTVKEFEIPVPWFLTTQDFGPVAGRCLALSGICSRMVKDGLVQMQIDCPSWGWQARVSQNSPDASEWFNNNRNYWLNNESWPHENHRGTTSHLYPSYRQGKHFTY